MKNEPERSCSVFKSRELAGVWCLQPRADELKLLINTNLTRSRSQSLWVCHVMSEPRGQAMIHVNDPTV